MIIFKEYNDYELIYMIRHEESEEALSIMFEKYKNFISTKIISLRVYPSAWDDFLQEGMICLYKAIYDYDEKYGKTFLRFFEICLERRYMTIMRHNKAQKKAIVDYLEVIELKENSGAKQQIKEEALEFGKIIKKSKMEEIIYNEYFKKNTAIDEIVKNYGFNTKSVYNAINRLRQKLKK